jgi:putative transposase
MASRLLSIPKGAARLGLSPWVSASGDRIRRWSADFFRSAKTVTGVTPDRVTTDGHDAYPRAIRTELGKRVRHRTNRYLNNRLEQDHRGIKGRCRPMLGFKSTTSARRYCRGHDELRNFLRVRSRMRQHVPAMTRRFRHMRRTAIALGILEAA